MLLSKHAIYVPENFKPAMPFPYPSDNHLEFERWYSNVHETAIFDGIERVYLPIMWTAYYVKHGIYKASLIGGTCLIAFNQLQDFIDRLPKDLKYYTIIQHDDGILHDLSGLDVFVFGMGAKSNYTLPLLSQPHRFDFNHNKTILASFMGMNTHPIRVELAKQFATDLDVVIHLGKSTLKMFCDTMSRSKFAFCPRGYGATSFRIQEAIQYDCIPIYISDEILEPYGIDFNLYGIKVRPDELSTLPALMSSYAPNNSICEPEVIKYLYTYEGCKLHILQKLKII